MIIFLIACGSPGVDDKKEQENYINYMNEQSRTRPIYEDGNMAFTRTVAGGTDIFSWAHRVKTALILQTLGQVKTNSPPFRLITLKLPLLVVAMPPVEKFM